MKTAKYAVGLFGTAALFALSAGCGKKQDSADASDPIILTVWTYYNGDQLESFNKLVDEFNSSVGKEKAITVESYSQGTVNDLKTNVLAAAVGKVGASAMPNIFSAYADTVYTIDQMDQLVDLRSYFSDEECTAYVDNYLEEGDFSGDGSIKIFPVAKSTEGLYLNDTDWAPFAAATGASYDDLSTLEGLVATAEKYYNWTDAQTPEANDGHALFGRDAMANYMLVGAMQLGCQIFEVKGGAMTLNFDKDVVRKLWDYYYVPYIKGYFASSGRFRSDDVKTGNILSYVGSTSSASFFPDHVMTDDSEGHDITMKVLPCPKFVNGEDYAVQQGAGMVVTRSSDEEIEACVEFLKWFTSPEHNIAFSVGSGYLPVTKEANDMEEIRKSGLELNDTIESILTSAVNTINSNQLYTTPVFSGANDARSVLEYAMSDAASADRATIVGRMENGTAFEDAAAEFLADSYFDSWYQTTLTKLEAFQG